MKSTNQRSLIGDDDDNDDHERKQLVLWVLWFVIVFFMYVITITLSDPNSPAVRPLGRNEGKADADDSPEDGEHDNWNDAHFTGYY